MGGQPGLAPASWCMIYSILAGHTVDAQGHGIVVLQRYGPLAARSELLPLRSVAVSYPAVRAAESSRWLPPLPHSGRRRSYCLPLPLRLMGASVPTCDPVLGASVRQLPLAHCLRASRFAPDQLGRTSGAASAVRH